MSVFDTSTKVGRQNQNLILETAGRIWIKVQDRFYELNFRNQNKGSSQTVNVTNNITETAEEPDLSNYVTKNYLKSTLTEYVTKRTWAGVKETTSMLENALLEGFTESISPITINTMQLVVGSEQLQYEFVTSFTNDERSSNAIITELTEYQVELSESYIKHYTIDGPTTARPQTIDNRAELLTQYSRWHIPAATLSLTEEGGYYVYLKVPNFKANSDYDDDYPKKKDNGNYSIKKEGNIVEKSLLEATFWKTNAAGAKNDNGEYIYDPRTYTYNNESVNYYSLSDTDGEYVVSQTAIAIDEEEDYYYFLYAIINTADDGIREWTPMNGFTEITPGRVTAYRFMSPDGEQYLNFYDKTFHLGNAALPGELATEGSAPNSYIHWDPINGLMIKGNITVTGGDLQSVLDNLQAQIDDEVQAWFSGDDANNNPSQNKHCRPLPNDTTRDQYTWPANTWNHVNQETNNTEYDYNEHVGDLFYITDGQYQGECYRFVKDGNDYVWKELADNSIAEALGAAWEAKLIAEAAHEKLTNWAADGVISPSEILSIREERNFVAQDYDTLTDEAEKYDLDNETDYTNYVNAEDIYLNWLDAIIRQYDNQDSISSCNCKDAYGSVALNCIATCSYYQSIILPSSNGERDFVQAGKDYYSKRAELYKLISESVYSKLHELTDTIAGYTYLKEAILNGRTISAGGLFLSSLIKLGSWEDSDHDGTNDRIKVMAGINGLAGHHEQDQWIEELDAIAAWYGGEMLDKKDYYNWNANSHAWELKSGETDPGNIAKTIFRHDGSGYLASGNIFWDDTGALRLPGLTWENEGGTWKIRLDSGSYIGGSNTTLGDLNNFFHVDDTNLVGGKPTIYLDGDYAGIYTQANQFISAGGLNSSGSGSAVSYHYDLNTGKATLKVGNEPQIEFYDTNHSGSGGGGTGGSVNWNDIQNKPSTIAGYNIADASIVNGVITLGQNNGVYTTITPVTNVSIAVGDAQHDGVENANKLKVVTGNSPTYLTIPYATTAGSATTLSDTTTTYSAWGANYWSGGQPHTISGDMSSVGKITFNKKVTGTNIDGFIEVKTEGNVNYLHTNLPFYSDSFISAGGLNSGSASGGITYDYNTTTHKATLKVGSSAQVEFYDTTYIDSHSSSGTDLTAVWTSLSGNTDSHATAQIHVDHLTNALANYQPLDSDLTAIAALTTSGFLKRTVDANDVVTWSLDNSTYQPLDTTLTAIGTLAGGNDTGFLKRSTDGNNNLVWSFDNTTYLPISGGELEGDLTSSAGTNDLGSSTKYWGDLYLKSGGKIYAEATERIGFDNTQNATNITLTGKTGITGDTTITGVTSITGNTSITGTLGVTDNTTLSGNLSVASNKYITFGGNTASSGGVLSTLSWDAVNYAWKITGNLYATGFISAGGLNNSTSDMMLGVWKSLTNNSSLSSYSSTTKISTDHIPIGDGLTVDNSVIITNSTVVRTSINNGLTIWKGTSQEYSQQTLNNNTLYIVKD